MRQKTRVKFHLRYVAWFGWCNGSTLAHKVRDAKSNFFSEIIREKKPKTDIAHEIDPTQSCHER